MFSTGTVCCATVQKPQIRHLACAYHIIAALPPLHKQKEQKAKGGLHTVTHGKSSELCCSGGMTRRISPTLSSLLISDCGTVLEYCTCTFSPPPFPHSTGYSLLSYVTAIYFLARAQVRSRTAGWLPFAHLISHPSIFHIWNSTSTLDTVEESQRLSSSSFLFSFTFDFLLSLPITHHLPLPW